ncbi:hypothetical protein AHAS_Ahas09G0124600 [Arachis hypogaea]
MNSHPFCYECDYNYVVSNGNCNDNMHQGWNNQRWEESQGIDQPSWQQPSQMYCEQEPFYDAYQDNGYGGPPCDYQQLPPYAYEPPPQYSPQPPYSQVPYHYSPPYDPNPYPPYQSPYEPYLEPPPFQHQYSQEPPFSYTPPQDFHQFEPPSNYDTLPPNNEHSLLPPPSLDKSLQPLCKNNKNF